MSNTVPRMHHFIRLAFAATELRLLSSTHAIVGLQKVSVLVDLDTGAITPTPTLITRARLPELVETLEGAAEKCDETPAGPFTSITDLQLGETRFAGEVRCGARMGELVLCLVAVPGPRVDCVAMSLRTHQVVRLPAQSASRLAAGPKVGACTVLNMLHVTRLHEGELQSLTVALPASLRTPDVAVAGTRIVVLTHAQLIVLDADALPFSHTHAAAPLTLTQREAGGQKLEGAAKVVFVLSDKVLVDHPVRKRLTLPRDASSPTVVKGDEVLIDDLREALIGDPRVHAWRKVGDADKGAPSASAITLAAPTLSVLSEVPSAPAPTKHTNRIRLEALAREHGFRVPPMLLRLLTLHDDDAVMRRLLGKLGMQCVEVRGLVGDWDADPCLIAFSGRGNGDETCLYIYPPSNADPLIVEFNHEENLVEPLALTFEDWMARELESVVTHAPDLAPLAARVREALGLSSTHTPPRDVAWPAWLDATRAIGEFKDAKAAEAKGRALMDEGKWVEAERYLLRAYLVADGASETRALLTRAYAELGWSLPRAHLASRDA